MMTQPGLPPEQKYMTYSQRIKVTAERGKLNALEHKGADHVDATKGTYKVTRY